MGLVALVLSGTGVFLWQSRTGGWSGYCRAGDSSHASEPGLVPAISTPGTDRLPPPSQVRPAPFAGSMSCRECHEEFYELWAPSHHGLAMRAFTREFAAAQLTPHADTIDVGGNRYRADLSAAEPHVLEQGPSGTREYPLRYALGGKNVYYFLTPLERGRLQVLPVAYHVHKRQWYNATASMVRHGIAGDEAIDWRDPMLTFNTSCYGCHVSQLSTNYDPASGSYRTVWAEPGINCETCHGPGAEHIRVCKAADEGEVPRDLRIRSYKNFTIAQSNATCAGCHAKAGPITPSFQPGERFWDHYDLVTFESEDYYPDGRDLGENYTYTSWLSSPCVQSGKLACTHCHTSSGRYRFKGAKANQACAPCHQARVDNPAPHTHHPPDKGAWRCVSCHMPTTQFAHMARSDHSMRPPAPGATLAFQSPNACNLCHTKKDAKWANQQVRKWHKRDYQDPVLRLARLIGAARKQQWDRLDEMLAYLESPRRDEVFAASLVRLLGSCPDGHKWPALTKALGDTSPLVRGSAAAGLADYFAPDALTALLKATADEYRLVRIRAASALAGFPRERLSVNDRVRLANATGELISSLHARPDQWMSHYNLGNHYASRGELSQAIASFERAHRLRPDTVMPLMNAAIAFAQLNQPGKAEEKLRQAPRVDPKNAAVNLNLGMLHAEAGRVSEAEKAFRTSLKTDPNLAQAAYNLGVLLCGRRPAEGIAWCRKAATLRPYMPKYAYTLAFYQSQAGQVDAAIRTFRDLIARLPSYGDAYFLLGQLYVQHGSADQARALYTAALRDARLAPQLRSALAAQLRHLGPPGAASR